MSGKFDFNCSRLSNWLLWEMSRYFGVCVAIICSKIRSKKEFFRPYCCESPISISFCWWFSKRWNSIVIETDPLQKSYLVYLLRQLASTLFRSQTEFACPCCFESVAASRLCWPFSNFWYSIAFESIISRTAICFGIFCVGLCMLPVFIHFTKQGSSSWRS